ncbi:MAG TPA: hypothetical protein VKQ54_05775 [Caulobacteraceae bacterium]|nr:hypothetical protein [Caulobacteraceae bacterium]
MPNAHPPAHLTEGLSNLLYRELAEIYLLIDYISSSCGKALPYTLALTEDKSEKSDNWIARVAAITWPPHGTKNEITSEAEYLIKIRDRLNRTVAPATGASIAFTIMSGSGYEQDDEEDETIEEDGTSIELTIPTIAEEGDSIESTTDRDNSKFVDPQRSGRVRAKSALRRFNRARYNLALAAFPNLRKPARRFAFWNFWLLVGLCVWLSVTILLSWYVTLGNDLVVQAYNARTELENFNPSSLISVTMNTKDTSSDGGSGSIGTKASDLLKWHFLCNRVVVTRLNLVSFIPELTLVSPTPPTKTACRRDDNGEEATSSPRALARPFFAVAWFNLLGGSLLPAAYGLLGAWAAVIRCMSANIKACVLTERELKLSVIRLVLGAVVGACIGLFMQPAAGSDAKNAVGLLGIAFLGASSLSFLAGFGVEHVFVVLDGVLNRAFSVAGTEQRDPSPGLVNPN